MATILQAAKLALRITSANTSYDTEIQDLIDSASADMIESGVSSSKAYSYDDPMIRRAVITFCKANFGWDNPDAERLGQSFAAQVTKIAVTPEYKAISEAAEEEDDALS